ncbi:MAG: hypothetical protein AB7S86_18055 [Hydrogenophaga sp.]|uniref:hypothetical protein n=1 Tax=Hydrogenophaga sp. TaxID=1904254 RepID=UPI003D0F5C35
MATIAVHSLAYSWMGGHGSNGGYGLPLDKVVTCTSKATAARDLAHLGAEGLLFRRGQGKVLRYFLNVPGLAHADRS